MYIFKKMTALLTALLFMFSMSNAVAQVTPQDEDEEAVDSFYESLSPGAKIGMGLGIVAVLVGIYFITENAKAEKEVEENEFTLKAPVAPAPETFSLMPDGWASKDGGFLGLMGSF